MIRTTWLLWRLLRELHLDGPKSQVVRRAIEFRIIVEPPSSYEARCKFARASGEPDPPRESMHEISYWPVAGQPCLTQRGATLAEALKRALGAPFPAPLA
jgi:hypothetical protein